MDSIKNNDTRVGIHFFEFLDIINCNLNILRYPNQNNRWTASIEHCEVKEGAILTGVYGNGKTPEEAMADYVSKVIGRHIVINAGSSYRREYHVPSYIIY